MYMYRTVIPLVSLTGSYLLSNFPEAILSIALITALTMNKCVLRTSRTCPPGASPTEPWNTGILPEEKSSAHTALLRVQDGPQAVLQAELASSSQHLWTPCLAVPSPSLTLGTPWFQQSSPLQGTPIIMSL